MKITWFLAFYIFVSVLLALCSYFVKNDKLSNIMKIPLIIESFILFLFYLFKEVLENAI